MAQEDEAIGIVAGPSQAEREALRWVESNHARMAEELQPLLRAVARVI